MTDGWKRWGVKNPKKIGVVDLSDYPPFFSTRGIDHPRTVWFVSLGQSVLGQILYTFGLFVNFYTRQPDHQTSLSLWIIFYFPSRLWEENRLYLFLSALPVLPFVSSFLGARSGSWRENQLLVLTFGNPLTAESGSALRPDRRKRTGKKRGEKDDGGQINSPV